MPAISPPPPIGDEDRVGRLRELAQDLHADGALPGDDVRIVERVDEREPALAGDLDRVLIGVVEIVTVQRHLAAEVEHRLHLDRRRRLRHHDDRRDAAAARRERDALCVVAGGRADHAAPGDGVGEVGDLVVGAAQLEREDRLQVLALEQDAVAEAPRQPRGRLEGRLDGDVVDARLEDAFDVALLHGKPGCRGAWPTLAGKRTAQRARLLLLCPSP